MDNLDLILDKEVQNYIDAHLYKDITRIVLSKSPFTNIDSKILAQQIEAKRKAKIKLPSWFKSQKIIYPYDINLQQSSSELTANHKAKQIKGNKIADITGGFGIDSYAFSTSFNEVYHIERNSELSRIVQQNMTSLEVKNVKCYAMNAKDFLMSQKEKFDYLFVDPSRRDATQNKVFRLEDCEPDLTEELDFYLSKSNKVYLKTSPLLDLELGLKQLKNVESVEIVAVQNEVKELLWLIGQSSSKKIIIKTINIINNKIQENLNFYWSDKSLQYSSFSAPQENEYLYEPNASLMKSGAYQYISKHFNLSKLEANSHLYTSSVKLDNFPGRKFKIDKILEYKPKQVKKGLAGKKFNLSARNFPIKVEDFKKKFKIKDGGETYVFLTTTIYERKIILICQKVN